MGKVILVDQDSIIADFYYRILEMYFEDTGTELAPEFIATWDQDFPNGKNIFSYFSQPGFFTSLKPIPGAQEVLKDLRARGNEIILASAATLTNAPGEKLEWLSKYFPWWDRNKMFFGKEKFRLHGDVLIDDHPGNMALWKKYWTQQEHYETLGLGIEYPYNADHHEAFDELIPSYRDFGAAWQRILTILG